MERALYRLGQRKDGARGARPARRTIPDEPLRRGRAVRDRDALLRGEGLREGRRRVPPRREPVPRRTRTPTARTTSWRTRTPRRARPRTLDSPTNSSSCSSPRASSTRRCVSVSPRSASTKGITCARRSISRPSWNKRRRRISRRPPFSTWRCAGRCSARAKTRMQALSQVQRDLPRRRSDGPGRVPDRRLAREVGPHRGRDQGVPERARFEPGRPLDASSTTESERAGNRSGDEAGALASYKKAMAGADKDDAFRLSAVARCASIHEKNGDYKEALADYRDLIRNAKDPELVVAAKERAAQLEAASK